MITCESLGSSLVDCLKGVSSLLESAHAVGLKEQDALVKNDAEAITITCRAQEEVLRRIMDADQRAAAITSKLAESVGISLDSADVNTIAEAAGFPYSELIKAETQNISNIAEKVHEVNEINSRLLQNGLEIITCCLRTLAADNGSGAYSRTSGVVTTQPVVLSLDIKA